MDPLTLLRDAAGPAGTLALLAVLGLLLRGDLTLGRETRREKEINQQMLDSQAKQAEQLAALVNLVRDRKP